MSFEERGIFLFDLVLPVLRARERERDYFAGIATTKFAA